MHIRPQYTWLEECVVSATQSTHSVRVQSFHETDGHDGEPGRPGSIWSHKKYRGERERLRFETTPYLSIEALRGCRGRRYRIEREHEMERGDDITLRYKKYKT